jgi:isopenicillin N synthase-like dioxygenase
MSQVPVIDCTAFLASDSFTSAEAKATISQIHFTFRTWGVFVLTGTNPIPPKLTNFLRTALNKFFSLRSAKKKALNLKDGGVAWRGYMPRRGEGTKRKEEG